MSGLRKKLSKALLFLLILLLIALVATAWRLASRKAAALRDFPPEGQFITVDGHPVHYLQMGEGPDLVLLHGASGNIRDFTFALAPELARHYRVTLFDRPGLGHTPRLAARGVSIRDQAALLSGAAVKLGLEAPVVVGQSFGGAVAAAWAVHFPDRLSALVSLAGATHPWEGPDSLLNRALAHPLVGPVISNLAAAWVPDSYVRAQIAQTFRPQEDPDGYADHIGAELVLRPRSLRANAQQRIDLREELRVQSALYPTLKLPVEILHGTADTTVGLEIHSLPLSREVAEAHLTRLPGIGHMPQHVARTQVIAAIDRAAARAGLR